MHLEAHAGLGWLIGTLAPDSDRRLRNCCVVAAVLPDIDAVAALHSWEAYNHWHHTFGHNAFLGVIVAAVCALWFHKDRPLKRQALVAVAVLLSFFGHLLTDAYFTRYEIFLFWPLNRDPYLFAEGYSLQSPINHYLVYGAFAAAVALTFLKGVSPLDVISPRLDRLVQAPFRKKDLECAQCSKPCNVRCDRCEAPTCGKHATLRWGFRVNCPECPKADPATEEAETDEGSAESS